MGLKILATADVHLGKRFSTFPKVQGELSEARFTCLERLVELANREACQLLVVAGDLFDRQGVPKAEVARAARTLSTFEGPLAAVLPGNHDFRCGSGGTLWRTFRESAGDRVLLLEDPRVYPLDHYGVQASLFAAPCDAKHSPRNAIGWITAVPCGASPAAGEGSPRIGVAHGSVEGLSLDSEDHYFPMTREELRGAGLDLWIVGHSHAVYPPEGAAPAAGAPAAEPLFVPGCPEPDGFDCRHPGNAWLLDLDGGAVRSRRLATGTYRFHRETVRLDGTADPEALLRSYGGEGFERALVRLDLEGRLSRERLREVRALLGELSQSRFCFEVGEDRLRETIDAAAIDAEFTSGSFPHRLLRRLAAEGQEEALQAAYELLQEARG